MCQTNRSGVLKPDRGSSPQLDALPVPCAAACPATYPAACHACPAACPAACPQNGEDQVSYLLFWQYLASLVSLPVCLALYLQLLQSGLLAAAVV